MSTSMIITMASIFIGFILFGTTYALFSYGKPRKLVWSVFAVAIVFITIIPTTIAIFFASVGS